MENIQISTQCIKSINSFGHTTYQNVCNGSVNVVPWGLFDGILMILGFSVLFAFAVGLAIFIYKIVNDDI